VDFLEKV
jgi:hypothetical protein